jgi:hypothetical protein
MQTLTSNYGQADLQLDDLVPTADLRWWLGRVHVATPVVEVEQKLRRKLQRDGIDPRWTPDLVEQTVQAALWLHKENLLEYKWVMKV